MRHITKPLYLYGLTLQLEADNRRAEKLAGIGLAVALSAVLGMAIIDLIW